MKTLTCSHCHQVLEVAEDRDAAMCPKCARGVRFQPSVPMIPFDQEIGRHRRRRKAALGLLIILIAIGFLLLLYCAVTDYKEPSLLVVGVIVILGGPIAAAIVAANKARKPKPVYDTVHEEVAARDLSSRVLDYRKPVLQDSRREREASIAGQFIVGVVAGIVGIFICAIFDAPKMLLAIPLVGLALLFVRGARAVGLGIIISIVVAILFVMEGFRNIRM